MAFAWVNIHWLQLEFCWYRLQDAFFHQGIIKKERAIYSNNVHVKNCFSQETENPAIVSASDFSQGSTIPINDVALNFPAGELVA